MQKRRAQLKWSTNELYTSISCPLEIALTDKFELTYDCGKFPCRFESQTCLTEVKKHHLIKMF